LLDAGKTSPYTFYQYGLTVADADAEKFIKIFTFLPKEEIEALVAAHRDNPGARSLQKRLAEEVTTLVHGEEQLEVAVAASELLFGKATKAQLQRLKADDLLSVFEGVPQANVPVSLLEGGLGIVEALTYGSTFVSSSSEARRALKENSVQVNKERVADNRVIGMDDLLCDRFILLQRGKKNYFLLIAE